MAKATKPHTVGDQLMLPMAGEIANIMLAGKAWKRMNAVSLSDDAVQH
jgi:hypothetical protein